ncbi:DUF4410 domain-containing protein [Congregibacter litoralis]|uniref:DUF4410 domain-containing protein n=1 Tax=Congregibacter litoralis KT71 TaxID=314285 RepID=A4A4U1_9GAMM|nr:DUF4410 domain-containing protein [Congregibacter litoralis]EAQ98812.2 Domain protein of unknown function [Congregibacter litoralis KT71]
MKHSIRFSKYLTAAFAATFLLVSMGAGAAGKMDRQKTYSDSISKTAAIHVHPFGTAEADLGKPKFRDTAATMAKSAPHLLATDIVESLRRSGFSSVTLDESEEPIPSDAINVTGRFTKLDPGSQNLRVWIGFGAGKSKVCIEGEITDSDGNKLADFADCRSGLGWGSSAPQGNKGAEILGERVAGFLIDWQDS